MATNSTGHVIEHLRRMLLPDEAGLTDAQLLASFIDSREEAAFAALVKRHGPLVWGVCRRLLNPHDAEDAFQATFLVLVRKAPSIRHREMLASWLYGVAHQTALRARRTATRRKAREKQIVDMPEPALMEPDLWNDLQPLLDREVSRLPDKYRVVLLLCDLEGKTRKEAARQLGLPEGTVASRLARARTMLAKRLARHGLAVSGGMLAGVLSQQAAPASVPPCVVSATIKAATLLASGQAVAAAAIPAKVSTLTEGVLKTMLLSKLKIATATLLLLAALAAGAGLTHPARSADQSGAKSDGSGRGEAGPGQAGAAGDKATGGRPANTRDQRLEAHRALVLEWCKDVADGKTGKKMRWGYFAPRFMKEAEENPEDFVGGDALCWVVGNGKPEGPEFAKAVALLSRHQLKGGWAASYLCGWLNAPRYFATASDAVEGLLREIMKTNPQPTTRAEAWFCLAQLLHNKADFARVLRRPEASDLARRVADCWGQDYLTRLQKADPDELDREATGLFLLGRTIHARYWDNHVTLGKRAPETKGKDLEGKFMALGDYRGKVIELIF